MSSSRPVPDDSQPGGGVKVALDEAEWALVCSLREVAPSVLRSRTTELMGELLAFVGAPGCTTQQADGVPCETARASCDECERVLQVIGELQARIQRG